MGNSVTVYNDGLSLNFVKYRKKVLQNIHPPNRSHNPESKKFYKTASDKNINVDKAQHVWEAISENMNLKTFPIISYQKWKENTKFRKTCVQSILCT